jgi:hypothetical protein
MKPNKVKKLVVNKEQPNPATDFQKLSFTINTAASVREETLEGIKYKVVPMVMMTEGIHNGSNGPLFYSAEELKDTPSVWNHKPIVVNHPMVDGSGVSACDPTVIETHKVGIIMNAHTDVKNKKTRLCAEAWINTDKAALVDNRVNEALDEKTVMEVSTGLFVDNVAKAGFYNGTPYDYVATNFKPDHLAILPDSVGACSVADGAGLIRNSENKGTKKLSTDVSKALQKKFDLIVQNALSFGTTQTQLQALIRTKCREKDAESYPWVEDVFSNFVIYSCTSTFYKVTYNIENNIVTLTSEPTEVVRVVTYQEKSPVMNKTELINKLIGNGANSGFNETDKQYLEGLSVERLQSFVGAEKAPITNKEEPKTPIAPVAAPVLNKEDAEALAFGRQTLAKQKTLAVNAIKANANNTFTDEQLSAMTINQLEALAKLATPTPAADLNNEDSFLNYGGQAPVTNQDKKEADTLEVPSLSWK